MPRNIRAKKAWKLVYRNEFKKGIISLDEQRFA